MLEFGFRSDTGKKRENNQDAFFVMPEAGIFLVADGVELGVQKVQWFQPV